MAGAFLGARDRAMGKTDNFYISNIQVGRAKNKHMNP